MKNQAQQKEERSRLMLVIAGLCVGAAIIFSIMGQDNQTIQTALDTSMSSLEPASGLKAPSSDILSYPPMPQADQGVIGQVNALSDASNEAIYPTN